MGCNPRNSYASHAHQALVFLHQQSKNNATIEGTCGTHLLLIQSLILNSTTLTSTLIYLYVGVPRQIKGPNDHARYKLQQIYAYARAHLKLL